MTLSESDWSSFEMDGLPPPESVEVQVDDTEVEAGGAGAWRLAEGQDGRTDRQIDRQTDRQTD